MLIKKTTIICVFIILPYLAIGQLSYKEQALETRKNTVSIELLGHGFLYSLNYERTLFKNDWTHTNIQIGASYYPKQIGFIPFWMPITVNQSFRLTNNHFIELGFGKLLKNDITQGLDGEYMNNYTIIDWVFKLGYKTYIKDKYVIKAFYSPLYIDKSDLIHWGGIGLGYRF